MYSLLVLSSVLYSFFKKIKANLISKGGGGGEGAIPPPPPGETLPFGKYMLLHCLWLTVPVFREVSENRTVFLIFSRMSTYT